ncbi:DUF302 domain-containing protein [Leptolyngbyaceae cyanobacterium CCMR0082]|uniref:DUF302 domain-containing protein n=1 Tax=Adonisia turfae CCMR0082 TaxID=2304604 RepID=A0A6M0SFH7_9CYAN|nr:DUF302 domain-containing protein [Adonisia turfae]NEZ67277.1 DUF302 domain-containing protein [Adonisia turfae CCMR0082]
MRNITAGIGFLGLILIAGAAYFSRQQAVAQATGPTGLVVKSSPYSVGETETRFKKILETNGLNLFATVDHAQNASGVGLELRPTRVVIFGNPKLGTPLMQCQPTIAIDLPQKVLIWEDDQGQTQLAYNDPQYLGGRHRLDGCGVEAIKTVSGALNNLTNGAIAP